VSAGQSQAWRQHFSKPAADILSVAACLAGFDLQAVLLRCFKRSRANRINEPTVLAVLQEISDEQERLAEELAQALEARS
jgi:hypothetical protein